MIPEPEPKTVPSGAPVPQLSVLVVDDSKLQRKILSMALSRKGYRVIEAEDGDHGLSLFRNHHVDIVLSDWMMPGLSGPELCRKIRELEVDHYVYVILLTTKTEKDEIAAGFEAGADDFLSKPVHSVELMARITAGERVMRMERELTRKNALVSETLSELKSLYHAIDADLIEARKLQQSLLPDKVGRFGSAQLAVMLKSSGHVGGDLVGYFRINARQVGLYSLDVSGHGISSALMTARLAGVLTGSVPGKNIAISSGRDGLPVARDPGLVAADLNRLLLEEMETEHYFTIILGVMDVESGRVQMVQAGHPHAIVARAAGEVETLGDGGLPIGLIDGAEYATFEMQLNPGDRLLLASDGFTECTSPSGDMLEEVGLAQWLGDAREADASAALVDLESRLSDFAGTAEFDDDISALVLDFRPETA